MFRWITICLRQVLKVHWPTVYHNSNNNNFKDLNIKHMGQYSTRMQYILKDRWNPSRSLAIRSLCIHLTIPVISYSRTYIWRGGYPFILRKIDSIFLLWHFMMTSGHWPAFHVVFTLVEFEVEIFNFKFECLVYKTVKKMSLS